MYKVLDGQGIFTFKTSEADKLETAVERFLYTFSNEFEGEMQMNTADMTKLLEPIRKIMREDD